MKKVEITINNYSEEEEIKKIIIDDVNSCAKVNKQEKIDFLYTEKDNKKKNLSYFEIEIKGKIKILATTGKVELTETPPIQKNIIQTWEEPL